MSEPGKFGPDAVRRRMLLEVPEIILPPQRCPPKWFVFIPVITFKHFTHSTHEGAMADPSEVPHTMTVDGAI